MHLIIRENLSGLSVLLARFFGFDAGQEAVRGHWGIENELPWVLDIAFPEDDCRVRKDDGPQNFAVLRHIALNLPKPDTTAKLGIKNKRLQAAWDETYLLTLLSP